MYAQTGKFPDIAEAVQGGLGDVILTAAPGPAGFNNLIARAPCGHSAFPLLLVTGRGSHSSRRFLRAGGLGRRAASFGTRVITRKRMSDVNCSA
jgi:hypothetical protein